MGIPREIGDFQRFRASSSTGLLGEGERIMTQALDEPRPRRLQPVESGRRPPYDLDAEQSVLGAMLLSRDAIAAALEQCRTEDFYRPAHGHIFDAITTLYARGEPADPVTVADELRRSGLLESVGDPSLLLSLQVNTPSTANAGYYAHIVEEHALLRKLVSVAGEIAELGYSVPEDVNVAIDQAESMVFDIAQRRVVDTTKHLRDLLEETLDRIEALVDRNDAVTGVPTGYADLDEALSGLQNSNLVVVGARPGAGKTSLALGMIAHAAVHAREPVLLFSLEMSHLELSQRLLCSEARVDSKRMRNGGLLESDWPKISDAIGRLGDAPIYIDDNPMVTVMDIRAKARRQKARDGLGLVVVDYLQLMSGHGRNRNESRQVEVSEISRGLKVLARELNVPVVALSQLSRNLESRQDKRPVLADLRESGCLTADTRVTRADTGAEVTLGELFESRERNIPVWALDDQLRMVRANMTHVFSSGIKETFEMQLASGRRVRASANHPFKTHEGWRRLDQLGPGARVAAVTETSSTTSPSRRSRTRRPFDARPGALGSPATMLLERPPVASVPPEVAWDEIVAIDNRGRQEVFDATVEDHHNFLANGIVAHNSIEQDADVVLFIYRDELYNPESTDRGTAEVIIAKHRNGPTGVINLAFLSHYTRFADMARV
jgi:replicative DNA helicase